LEAVRTAAPNRPQPQRNGHPPRRRIVDTIRATLGRGRAAVRHMRPTNAAAGRPQDLVRNDHPQATADLLVAEAERIVMLLDLTWAR
jgi:hypothetical protein